MITFGVLLFSEFPTVSFPPQTTIKRYCIPHLGKGPQPIFLSKIKLLRSRKWIQKERTACRSGRNKAPRANGDDLLVTETQAVVQTTDSGTSEEKLEAGQKAKLQP